MVFMVIGDRSRLGRLTPLSMARLGNSQDKIKTNYTKKFKMSEAQFGEIHMLFSPFRVPAGLNKSEMDTLVFLCSQPGIIEFRKYDRCRAIVPTVWYHREGKKITREAFAKGLVEFLRQAASFQHEKPPQSQMQQQLDGIFQFGRKKPLTKRQLRAAGKKAAETLKRLPKLL